jgi:hypothetical protein
MDRREIHCPGDGAEFLTSLGITEKNQRSTRAGDRVGIAALRGSALTVLRSLRTRPAKTRRRRHEVRPTRVPGSAATKARMEMEMPADGVNACAAARQRRLNELAEIV